MSDMLFGNIDPITIAFNILGSDIAYFTISGAVIFYAVVKKTTMLDKYLPAWIIKAITKRDKVQEAVENGKVIGYDPKTKTLYVEDEKAETEVDVIVKPKAKPKIDKKETKAKEPTFYDVLHQPNCDCQCHQPDSQIAFCYKCTTDKKCTIGSNTKLETHNWNNVHEV